MKTTIHIPYDKCSFHSYDNADEVLGSNPLIKRRRPDLEERNDVTECFHS